MKISIFSILFFNLALLTTQANSIKFSTNSICLNQHAPDSFNRIKCEAQSTAIFITLVQYSNDYLNECGDVLENRTSNLTQQCVAYPTQSLSEFCNGKTECLVKLDRSEFKFGTMGANCDFVSSILLINYECIPTNFSDTSIPKFDICSHTKILNPHYGFIHTPNYPDTYPATQYCQLTVALNEQIERVELFLIDMETEALSLKTYEPTDYLEIDLREKFFGKKHHLFIHNSTRDVLLKFRTDLFFNKRGFCLYFQAIRKIDAIEETKERVETSTKLAQSTTTTQIQTLLTTTLALTSLNSNESTNSSIVLLRAHSGRTQAETLDLISSLGKIKSDSSINTTVLLLGALVLFLSSLVVVLIIANRRRIFGQTNEDYYAKNSFISRPIASKMNDTSIFNPLTASIHHLSTANLSNGTVLPLNAAQLVVPAYKVHSGQRMSDDSMTHLLLLNTTSSSYMEPFSRTSSNEANYNLKELDEKIVKKLESQSNTVKPNEYCYIHANGLVIGSIQNSVQVEIPQQANANSNPKENDTIKTSEPISPSSSLCMISSSLSPCTNNNNLNPIISSTPSPPKTLPPTIHKNCVQNEPLRNDEETNHEYDNNFESSEQTVVELNEGKKMTDEEKENQCDIIVDSTTNEEANEDDEYQVPINLPK